MRRVILFTVLLLAALFSTSAEAAGKKKRTIIRKPGNMGLGLGAISTTTGLSGKLYPNKGLSLQGTIGGWGLGLEPPGGLAIAADADLLVELPIFLKTKVVNVAPVIGGGGWIRMAEELTEIGANATAGVTFLFKAVPVEASLEYRPTFGVINTQARDWTGFGVHLRYVFRAPKGLM